MAAVVVDLAKFRKISLAFRATSNAKLTTRSILFTRNSPIIWLRQSSTSLSCRSISFLVMVVFPLTWSFMTASTDSIAFTKLSNAITMSFSSFSNFLGSLSLLFKCFMNIDPWYVWLMTFPVEGLFYLAIYLSMSIIFRSQFSFAFITFSCCWTLLFFCFDGFHIVDQMLNLW